MATDGYRRFSDNAVSFVTFNYDRSLEYFLAASLRNDSSELDWSAAHALVGRIRFVRGCVGGGPFLHPNATPYGGPTPMTEPAIIHAGDGIHLVHEGTEAMEAIRSRE